MNLLPFPYREWTVASPADLKVTAQRVRGAIAAKVFTGDVHPENFRIFRLSESRQSGQAVEGTLTARPHGTDVWMCMKPPVHGLGWVAAAIYAGFYVGRPAWTEWQRDGTVGRSAAVAGILLVAYYLLIMGQFLLNASYLERELFPLLRASVQPDELRSVEPDEDLSGRAPDRPQP